MHKGLVFTLIFILILSVPGYAVPYSSFSATEGREPFFIQNVYLPQGLLGQNLFIPCENGGVGERVLGLTNPTDVFIDKSDRIFVADRDNHRIVQINASGALLQEIGVEEGAGRLRLPEGVFVADNGDIWVADTGHNRVVRFNEHGEYINSFGQADDIRLQNSLFIPINVALDLRGDVFVLLRGSNEGLMMMSPEGEFLGFFGRNRTPLTLVERMLRLIYTEEQIRTNLNRIAPSPTGMAIGVDGFIYTITQATDGGQIKKLNVNSEDLFHNANFQINNPFFDSIALSAIAVTESGLIYVTDRSNGMVYVHDNNGNLLVGFGERLVGGDFRVGVFGEPVGIAVNSAYEVFVLDRLHSSIHIFTPTEMMLNFISGVSRNAEGRHEDARDNWETVLRQNAFIRPASVGLGQIYHRQGDYLTAMGFMRNAINQELYSAARWQQRIIVVRQVFPIVAAVLAGLFLLKMIWSKVLRLELQFTGKIKLPNGLRQQLDNFIFALRMMKSPSDTLYSATYGNRGGVISAVIWLVLYLLTAIVSLGITSFSFEANGLRSFNVVQFLTFNLLPIPVWIIAGYLVGTITKGQGQFVHIFIGTVYALMPLILLRIPLAFISHALTRAELAIYFFLQAIMWGWTIVLQFQAIKEIQGYFLGETVKNTAWMGFVSAMMVVFSVALYGVAMQTYSFLDEFIRELIGLV